MKRLYLLTFILFAFALAAPGQKYYNQKSMNKAREWSFYTITPSTIYGDTITGMIFPTIETFSRDNNVYENWDILSATDDNGRTYHSYLSDKDGGWITIVPVAKGMFSLFELTGGESLVIPSTVTHLKEITYRYGYGNEKITSQENFHTKNKTVRSQNITIKWMNFCMKNAMHPAEYYFNKQQGPAEIVSGKRVKRYKGHTIIKKAPECMHLVGAIGNSQTGEVCFIFSIYGLTDNEILKVKSLTAYDEDGNSYSYSNDSYGYDGEKVGRKYGIVEFSIIPFKVPAGTASLQKLKMTGENDACHSYYSNVELEWTDIPIQWINPNK